MRLLSTNYALVYTARVAREAFQVIETYRDGSQTEIGIYPSKERAVEKALRRKRHFKEMDYSDLEKIEIYKRNYELEYWFKEFSEHDVLTRIENCEYIRMTLPQNLVEKLIETFT